MCPLPSFSSQYLLSCLHFPYQAPPEKTILRYIMYASMCPLPSASTQYLLSYLHFPCPLPYPLLKKLSSDPPTHLPLPYINFPYPGPPRRVLDRNSFRDKQNYSESFRYLYPSQYEPIRKRFESRLFKNALKLVRLNPIQSETSIRTNPK